MHLYIPPPPPVGGVMGRWRTLAALRVPVTTTSCSESESAVWALALRLARVNKNKMLCLRFMKVQLIEFHDVVEWTV